MMDVDVNQGDCSFDPKTNNSNELFDVCEFETKPDWIESHLGQNHAPSRNPKQRWITGSIYVVVFFLGVGIAFSMIQSHHSVSNEQEIQTNDTGTVTGADTITIDVHGDVRHPGMYHLPANARVLDAVFAAGGYLNDRDSQSVNQAQPLVDGQEVMIGKFTSSPENTMSNRTLEPSAYEGNLTEHTQILKIDLNTADEATLETISGIGPRRARAVISYRNAHGPFKSLLDLRHVRGFGKAALTKLSPYIFVEHE